MPADSVTRAADASPEVPGEPVPPEVYSAVWVKILRLHLKNAGSILMRAVSVDLGPYVGSGDQTVKAAVSVALVTVLSRSA